MLHAATLMEAWVEISDDNGARWTKLQEYKPDSTADSATCYVEAKTGQLFRMCLFDSTTGSTSIKMATHFFYDGHLAQASVKQAHDLPSTAVEGVRNGSGYLLPFRFKDLLTTNDEARACDTQASQDVGQLRIDLWRVDVIGPPEPPRHHDYTKRTAELFLEQRVKKKSGHQVGFGEAKVVEPQANLRTKKLDKKPFLTFRFNYLSEALLDLNKIRPFKIAAAPADPEVQAHASESNSSSTSAQPSAGTSEQRAKSATVKIEKIAGSNALSSTQSKGKGRVINIDDDDDETELERLRAENARLRKKVKLENTGKKQVIDLSLD